ncbi:MAG: Fic family protein [Candidatus Gottesmanbacteria bacterium]
MKFPPIFEKTESLLKTIYDLDVLKAAFELHPIAKEVVVLKRDKSILKSALFSARIEGNPLTFEEITMDGHELSGDPSKREVFNLVTLYEHIDSFTSKSSSKELIKDIHEQALHGISTSNGLFRIEDSAIWNQAGVAVYITPAPQQIFPLLDELFSWIKDSKEHPAIVASLAHIWFEKIHPFDDGNGRVGRFLSTVLLSKGGFGFGGLVPIEEYLEKFRDDYYFELGKDKQDVTSFIEFFIRGLVSQIQTSLKESETIDASDTVSLSPRRAELVAIIRDHKSISFDALARRFRSVPSRSLHNDLSQLIKTGYIRKRGATRGVLYEPTTIS